MADYDGKMGDTWIEIKTKTLASPAIKDVSPKFMKLFDAIENALEWLDAPKAADLPEWATIQEVADLMRMDRKTIANAMSAGQLPSRKIGSHYRLHVPTIIEAFKLQLDEQSDETNTTPKSRPSGRKVKKRRRKTKKTTKKKVT